MRLKILKSRGGVLQELDPRVKLFSLLLLSTLIFTTQEPMKVTAFLGILLLTLILGRISVIKLIEAFKQIIIFIAITSALNAFLVEGEVIWSWGALKVTKEGLEFALLVGARITFISLLSLVIISNLSYTELAVALKRFMAPLKLLGLPVEDVSLGLTIALRFVPVFMNELDRIYISQLAKGIELRQLSFKRQMEFWLSVVIPLMRSALKRAEDLAVSLEMRGYYESTEVELTNLRYTFYDLVTLLSLLGFTIWVLWR